MNGMSGSYAAKPSNLLVCINQSVDKSWFCIKLTVQKSRTYFEKAKQTEAGVSVLVLDLAWPFVCLRAVPE